MSWNQNWSSEYVFIFFFLSTYWTYFI